MLRFPRCAAAFAALVTLALPLRAATVSVALTGDNGAGALNMVDFDNETEEPSAPGDSFGYAYYFNPDRNYWSILPSSPTIADAAYYAEVLTKAGIPFTNLTVATVEENVDVNVAMKILQQITADAGPADHRPVSG